MQQIHHQKVTFQYEIGVDIAKKQNLQDGYPSEDLTNSRKINMESSIKRL